MKTTDLLYQNQRVLNELQEMLLISKKHVEFLAANAPEIRASLESIAESLQTGCDILENQIVFNRDTRNKFAEEVACKNQAYDFIFAENLVGRFKTFCECYPTNLYIGLTGVETLQVK
ncbi:MAG: hypothetical protein [Bacteriophage sp.]|nr:MAG: hypothetical protein [Bacteriophage sp.]